MSLAANPNWRPGFNQVPADGSRTASLRDAFITGGDIELAYTVETSRTVIARARIIGTTARVDGIAGGSADITVTATAPNGTTATQTFPVRVREDLQPEPTPTPAPPPTPTPLPPVVTDTPTPPHANSDTGTADGNRHGDAATDKHTRANGNAYGRSDHRARLRLQLTHPLLAAGVKAPAPLRSSLA